MGRGKGDLVAFEAGVVCAGYSGEVGRTCAVGYGSPDTDLWSKRDQLWDRLITSCRPGAPASALLDAYGDTGTAPPPMPVARGLGRGFDLPLVAHALPRTAADQQLEAGMVFAMTAYVWKEGVGGVYGQEPIVLTETGPELLSSKPFRDARSQ